MLPWNGLWWRRIIVICWLEVLGTTTGMPAGVTIGNRSPTSHLSRSANSDGRRPSLFSGMVWRIVWQRFTTCSAPIFCEVGLSWPLSTACHVGITARDGCRSRRPLAHDKRPPQAPARRPWYRPTHTKKSSSGVNQQQSTARRQRTSLATLPVLMIQAVDRGPASGHVGAGGCGRRGYCRLREVITGTPRKSSRASTRR